MLLINPFKTDRPAAKDNLRLYLKPKPLEFHWSLPAG